MRGVVCRHGRDKAVADVDPEIAAGERAAPTGRPDTAKTPTATVPHGAHPVHDPAPGRRERGGRTASDRGRQSEQRLGHAETVHEARPEGPEEEEPHHREGHGRRRQRGRPARHDVLGFRDRRACDRCRTRRLHVVPLPRDGRDARRRHREVVAHGRGVPGRTCGARDRRVLMTRQAEGVAVIAVPAPMPPERSARMGAP